MEKKGYKRHGKKKRGILKQNHRKEGQRVVVPFFVNFTERVERRGFHRDDRKRREREESWPRKDSTN